jgi:hypothetical protein
MGQVAQCNICNSIHLHTVNQQNKRALSVLKIWHGTKFCLYTEPLANIGSHLKWSMYGTSKLGSIHHYDWWRSFTVTFELWNMWTAYHTRITKKPQTSHPKYYPQTKLECLQAYCTHSCYFYDFKCNLKQQSSQAQMTAGNKLKDSYPENTNHSCSISLQSMHKNHMQTHLLNM